VRLDKFREANDDRLRLMIAASFLDEEGRARSEENDPSSKVLLAARDLLNTLITETLPPGDDD